MRFKEEIYFAPEIKFKDIDWEDKCKLIEAFERRVDWFIFKPARILNEKEYGFAAGLLCIAGIDLLASIFQKGGGTGSRFKKWSTENIECLNDRRNSEEFYRCFRNGLVHEGRIKHGGQFCYTIENIKIIEEDVMLVNPYDLLCQMSSAFDKKMKSLKEDENEFDRFKQKLKSYFSREIELST